MQIQSECMLTLPNFKGIGTRFTKFVEFKEGLTELKAPLNTTQNGPSQH